MPPRTSGGAQPLEPPRHVDDWGIAEFVLGLVLKRPPIRMDDVTVAVAWSERLHAEPGHRWFRQTVAQAIRGELEQERGPLPR